MLNNRNILLGITGSIAAYKSVEIARRLTEEGAGVRVVMTRAACRFITPYTLEAVTGQKVHTDLFEDPFSHLNLSRDSHLFVIAPVTANTINRLACGIADDLLSNLGLTWRGPVLMAPAMNSRMYQHAIVQESIRKLKKMGVRFIGPDTGPLACGEEGEGRMTDVSSIVDAVVTALTPHDFEGVRVLVTAGPTREPIDAVRYISNRSSGKMGYALARAAVHRGAVVTLISGPSAETPPEGAELQKVQTAAEMDRAMTIASQQADIIIMAAAVSDIAPASPSKVKLDKKEINILRIKKTKDIIKSLRRGKRKTIVVGFAAETGKNLKRARQKMQEKNLDMIVLNDISRADAGFDVDTNVITILDGKGGSEDYPVMKKRDAANVILDRIAAKRGR